MASIGASIETPCPCGPLGGNVCTGQYSLTSAVESGSVQGNTMAAFENGLSSMALWRNEGRSGSGRRTDNIYLHHGAQTDAPAHTPRERTTMAAIEVPVHVVHLRRRGGNMPGGGAAPGAPAGGPCVPCGGRHWALANMTQQKAKTTLTCSFELMMPDAMR